MAPETGENPGSYATKLFFFYVFFLGYGWATQLGSEDTLSLGFGVFFLQMSDLSIKHEV